MASVLSEPSSRQLPCARRRDTPRAAPRPQCGACLSLAAVPCRWGKRGSQLRHQNSSLTTAQSPLGDCLGPGVPLTQERAFQDSGRPSARALSEYLARLRGALPAPSGCSLPLSREELAVESSSPYPRPDLRDTEKGLSCWLSLGFSAAKCRQRAHIPVSPQKPSCKASEPARAGSVSATVGVR